MKKILDIVYEDDPGFREDYESLFDSAWQEQLKASELDEEYNAINSLRKNKRSSRPRRDTRKAKVNSEYYLNDMVNAAREEDGGIVTGTIIGISEINGRVLYMIEPYESESPIFESDYIYNRANHLF